MYRTATRFIDGVRFGLIWVVIGTKQENERVEPVYKLPLRETGAVMTRNNASKINLHNVMGPMLGPKSRNNASCGVP